MKQSGLEVPPGGLILGVRVCCGVRVCEQECHVEVSEEVHSGEGNSSLLQRPWHECVHILKQEPRQ